jgi:hypothetical protein
VSTARRSAPTAGPAGGDRGRAWVARAHRIVTDPRHLEDVRDAGGSPDVDYLGDRYGQGPRVLAVANVHRGFRSALFGPTNRRHTTGHADAVTSAVDATRRLSLLGGDDLDDAEVARYLAGVSPMYALGLSGGWTVGSVALAPMWSALGVADDPDRARRVADANVSCCQVPEKEKITDAARVKAEVKRLCSAVHPLSDAVDVLDPHVVFCTAKDAHDHLADHDIPARVLTVAYHQQIRSHRLLAAVSHRGLLIPAKTHRDEWVPRVRLHLQDEGLLAPGA